MDELISISRIGRSLGVHLILATQKPAGVVNDQIWSNSRFKVCLKVQTKSDSNEMLKKPDAASLKETGRFYLQVGYDELFNLGQAAWAGANYIPTQKVIKEVDDSINFVGNTGEVIKSANIIKDNSQNKSQGDQLTNIVKYLKSVSNKNNFKSRKLWLDSLEPEILLNDLIKKYNYSPTPYSIEALLGEYDNPEAQMQNLLKLDITNTGNTLIYGMPGSGKENLLTTMITSICKNHTVDEVMFYIMDFGAETLRKLQRFPQVGDVALIDEKEKINNLIILLMNEINRRKELFQDYMGSYNNYIKMSGKTIPTIICVIHGYENITENNYGSALNERLYALFKDGPKFGIHFIITNAISTGIRSRILQLFNNKIALHLSNPDDYVYTVNAKRNMIPSNYFGRGISNINDEIYEFQSAYISKPDDINNTIIDLSKELHEKSSKKAPKIPTLPEFLTVDKLLNRKYNLTNIPIGITKTKLSILNYDFAKSNFNPILSTDVNSNIHFVYGLIELLKQIPNLSIKVIDVFKIYNNSQGIYVYNDDFDNTIKQMKSEIINDSKLKKKNIFIIIGLGALKNNILQKSKVLLDEIFSNLKTYKNNSFIIYDDYNSYKSLEMENWFRDNVDQTTGIWLGDNADNQLAIKMPNLTLDDKRIMFKQIGYIVKNNSHTIVRYVVDKEFKDEK